MLIPDNISDFESIGEQLLYFRFKKDGSAEGMYVLHSVFTNYHLKNVSGELDFLVLAPGMGIFAIEVKHGRVTRSNGIWEFTNRHGHTSKKTKSPFSQVTGTMHSIRDYILKKAKAQKKDSERLSQLLWGTGIAFTSMGIPPEIGQEAESWQILTKEGLRLKSSQFIKSLSEGFHKKFKEKPWYNSNAARPTEADCNYIIKIIRGDFDTIYTDLNRMRDNDELIEEFTKEQFNMLDITNYNERSLFEGGAGTGKTLLALELMKRKCESGLKVCLFCYNRKLGEHIANIIERIGITSNYYAGSLHSYLLQNTAIEKTPDFNHIFFSEELPFEFLIQQEAINDDDKFDLLIIDEAQDLLNPYNIEVFDLLLKGGVKNGQWVFFGDLSNQAIYTDDSRDDLVRLLKEKADFVTLPPLKLNCRNTKAIATQNTLLSGAEYPEFINGGLLGKSVTQKFPAKNSYVEAIEDEIDKLLKAGIPAEDIIMLSPKKLGNSSLSASAFIQCCISKGVNYSTIQAYKGLEKNIVVLFDFNEVASPEAQRLLYVALSRARQLLYIIFPKNLEVGYNRLMKENLPKIK